MTEKEYLLAKSDGVLETVTWLKTRLKEQKVKLEKAKFEYKQMGGFEDCGSFY